MSNLGLQFIRLVAVSCIFFLLPVSSAAQNFYSISFDAGPKYAEKMGAGINGNINIGLSKVYVSINPLNINFVERDKYREHSVGSWKYCVDQQQVDIADPSNCSGRFKKVYGYAADVNYLMEYPNFLLALGVGYRFGTASTPYLNSEIIFQNKPWDAGHYWYGTVSAGYQMASVGFGIAFNL